jgi:hypothetical protein
MPLTCSCPDIDEDTAWFFIEPDDFTKLNTKKRKRCCSCKKLININDTCIKFTRFRFSRTDVEIKIYSEDVEIPIASFYMCEKCGDQYYNLSNLGFCIDISENMFELLKEYSKEYGRKS